MAVSQHLPFVMGEIFNRPLMVSEGQAEMIVSALAGRLNIQQLISENGGLALDARGMADLAAMGREAVDAAGGPAQMSASIEAGENVRSSPYAIINGIAIIPVKGTLKRAWGVGPYSGCTGYDGIWVQLAHAENNPDVKGIWFDINSGGGTTDGVFDLADGIYQRSARFGGKPKMAMAADFAASAAYLLGCACDQVVTPVTGMVGSIGCITIMYDVTGAMEQDGIKAVVVRSKAGKALGATGLDKLEEHVISPVQAMVDLVDQEFVRRVALFRGLEEKAVHETNAEVYTGRNALAAGLIDNTLSEQEAWARFVDHVS